MAFKMKGSAFKLGGVQGTDGHKSALQCRMYNKANNFTMKSPLEQSCPPGTAPVELDENGNPIQMKSALKQYTDEELARKKKNIEAGYTYGDETSVIDPETGITTYTTIGNRPGTPGSGGGGISYRQAWDNMTSEEQAKYGDFRRFEVEAKSYNEGTPGETDEMSYTTKPEIPDVETDITEETTTTPDFGYNKRFDEDGKPITFDVPEQVEQEEPGDPEYMTNKEYYEKYPHLKPEKKKLKIPKIRIPKIELPQRKRKRKKGGAFCAPTWNKRGKTKRR